MQLNGKPLPSPGELSTTPSQDFSLISRRPASRRWQSSSEEDEDDPRGRVGPPPFAVDVQKSFDEIVSSPDGTPSFISVEDRLSNRLKSPYNIPLLHAGRDFGGSASGNTSQAGSDTEFSAEEYMRKRAAKGKVLVGKSSLVRKPVGGKVGGTRGNVEERKEESGIGRGAIADALGDQSDVGSDGHGDEDAELEERRENSVEGSVY